MQKIFAECCLYTVPAVDVAPKSEVAREIFEEIENGINLGLLVTRKMIDAKVGTRANGKTILLAKYEAFTKVKKFIAELKKKYTEGEE